MQVPRREEETAEQTSQCKGPEVGDEEAYSRQSEKDFTSLAGGVWVPQLVGS